MTRATKAKGLPVNREPFAEFFSPFLTDLHSLRMSLPAIESGHAGPAIPFSYLGVDPGSSRNKEREMGRAMGDEPATPHGGLLLQLVAESERAQELLKQSLEWPSWELTPRKLCDLELLMCGGFSPLRGFMNQTEYESVCTAMRLPQGLLWPIPVTLDVPDAELAQWLLDFCACGLIMKDGRQYLSLALPATRHR